MLLRPCTPATCINAAAIALIPADVDGEPTEDDGGGKVACENESRPGDEVAEGFGEEEPIVIATEASLEDVILPGDLVGGDETVDFCLDQKNKLGLKQMRQQAAA